MRKKFQLERDVNGDIAYGHPDTFRRLSRSYGHFSDHIGVSQQKLSGFANNFLDMQKLSDQHC